MKLTRILAVLAIVLFILVNTQCTSKDAEYYKDKLEKLESEQVAYRPWKIIDVPAHPEYKYMVIVIDGCEYIYYDGYREGFIAHKGNCKFCNPERKHPNVHIDSLRARPQLY